MKFNKSIQIMFILAGGLLLTACAGGNGSASIDARPVSIMAGLVVPGPDSLLAGRSFVDSSRPEFTRNNPIVSLRGPDEFVRIESVEVHVRERLRIIHGRVQDHTTIRTNSYHRRFSP